MKVPIFERPVGRLVTVLVVCFFSFFLHLGQQEVSLMESRNFVAAREMAAGGSWLLPTMNEQLRLAKPPLPTWAVASVMQLVGSPRNEELFWLRLPAALMATAMVFFFWGLLRELTRFSVGEQEDSGRTAWLGSLVLASSLLVVTSGRDGQWDIFSNGFMVGSLWLLMRARRQGGMNLQWAGAGLLIGLSILSKGPVALYGIWFPFLVCVYQPRLWVNGQPFRQEWRGWVLLVSMAAGVGLAWPWYVWQHVAPHALEVARTEVSSWKDRHVQPFWYYFNFPVFTGVWALVALASLAVPYARCRSGRFVPYLLGLVWVAMALVLLSVVPEKKERYMMPLLFPLVLLLTGLLRSWETGFRQQLLKAADRWLLTTWAVLFTIVGVGLPVAMGIIGLPGFGLASPPFWAMGGLGLVVAGVIWLSARPRRMVTPGALMAAAIGYMAAAISILMPAYPVWEARKAEPGLRRLADVRRDARFSAYAWRSLSEFPIKQVWAAGRAVPLWHQSEAAPASLVLFSGSRLTAKDLTSQLPHYQIVQVDSFYLGRDRKSGQWYATLTRRVTNH